MPFMPNFLTHLMELNDTCSNFAQTLKVQSPCLPYLLGFLHNLLAVGVHIMNQLLLHQILTQDL